MNLMSEEYYQLEKDVLDSLLVKPELMENLEIDDKYFVKYKRLWIFMKSFYDKFHNFDIDTMASLSTSKNSLVRYVSTVQSESNASYVRFDTYLQRLKDMFEENKQEVAVIEKIYELSNDLFVRKIKLKDFYEKINQIRN